jgi:predicted enzyme related to lactoylglutathione lyase
MLPVAVEDGAITGAEIYLRCDDVEAAVDRLEAAGGRLLSALAPRDWGDDAAYYADPDGNVIVVARVSPDAVEQPPA